jgi:Swt1-like HEPN
MMTFDELTTSSAEEQLRLDGFLHLTRIEIGLRRLLEMELEEAGGNRWWRALPQDVVEKIVDGSLDYLDFADLKKVISSKWNTLGTLRQIGSKAQLTVHLEELEPIRNALAHSRSLSYRDLALVRATYSLVEPAIRKHLRKHASPGAQTSDAPEVVLMRIRARLEQNAPIPRTDFSRMQAFGDTGNILAVVEKVSAYDRVRASAGYSAQERRAKRLAAAAAVDDYLATVEVHT